LNNTQAIYRESTNDILIEVSPFFVPEKSNPAQDFYFYAYAVKITNQGKKQVNLKKRYWIIRNGEGLEEKIYGDGVVGKFPILKPGANFSYTSFCPLPTPFGNMRGEYEFVDDKEKPFRATIPLFFLRPPN